jgi:hypothetical protein
MGLVMRGGSSTLRSAMWGPPAALAAPGTHSAITTIEIAATTAAEDDGDGPIAAARRSFWTSGIRPQAQNPSSWGEGKV